MAKTDLAAPETTLADELSAAFDAAETTEAAPAPEAPHSLDAGQEAQPPTAQAPEAAPAKGPMRDAAGRFVKGEKAPEAAAPAEPAPASAPAAAPAQAPEPEAVGNLAVPPSTWTPIAKAEWAALPESVRKEVKKRESDMVRGLDQYRAAAQMGEALQAEMRPYEAIIRAEGGTPQTVVRSLLNTAFQLRQGSPQQRGALILQLAQQYGADLSAALAPQQYAQPYSPQAISQLVDQRLAPIVTQFQAAAQQREAAEQQQLQNHVEAFRNATGEDGKPLHVYFDNVRGIVASLLAEGHAQTLGEAYEMACNAHPEVRAARDAEQRAKAQTAQLAEAKRKADEAKRAGFNVSGQGGIGSASALKMSLRDELAAAMEGGAGPI